MIFLFSILRIILTVLGVIRVFLDWLDVSDPEVWFRRLQRCGVTILFLLFITFGIRMMIQSFNAKDLGANIVAFAVGIFILILGIAIVFKGMPKKSNSSMYYRLVH